MVRLQNSNFLPLTTLGFRELLMSLSFFVSKDNRNVLCPLTPITNLRFLCRGGLRWTGLNGENHGRCAVVGGGGAKQVLLKGFHFSSTHRHIWWIIGQEAHLVTHSFNGQVVCYKARTGGSQLGTLDLWGGFCVVGAVCALQDTQQHP